MDSRDAEIAAIVKEINDLMADLAGAVATLNGTLGSASDDEVSTGEGQ